MTPNELDATVMRDVIALINGRHNLILWHVDAPVWGLSIVVIKDRPWLAISVEGMIQLARTHFPHRYHDQEVPQVGVVAERLASLYKHAEVPGTKSYLFGLPETYGACGEAVLLAVIDPAAFPWVAQVAVTPRSSTPLQLHPDEWQRAASVPQISRQRAGAMAAVSDASLFLDEVLRGRPLVPGESNEQVRRRLIAAVEDEQRRLDIVRWGLPHLAKLPAYGDPPWFADASAEVDQYLSAGAHLIFRPAASVAGKATPVPTASRRPVHLPAPVPSSPMAADGLDDAAVKATSDELPPVSA